MAILNNVTLGGKPVHDPPPSILAGKPNPETNVFEMYTGATRYGKGRFLMTSDDYQSIVSASSGGTATLTLTSGPDASANKVSFSVVLAAAIPYSTSADSSGAFSKDMLEVVVFDTRSTWSVISSSDKSAFNVQQDGFPYTGTTPIFYSATLNSTSQYTWNNAITTMELPITVFPNFPTWKPRNLIYDASTKGQVMDDIAAKLYLVMGFDWTKGTISTVDALSFLNPGDKSSTNTTQLANAANYVIGGDLWQRNPKRLPDTIRVNFRIYNADDPTNPYPSTTRSYHIDVSNSGGANFKQQISVGNFVAIYSGGAVANTAELTTVANDIGARAKKYLTQPMGEMEYAGIWPFIPDGYIRGIKWSSNRNGATTKIRIGNDKDFSPFTEAIRVADSVTNQLVVGLGSASAANSPSGTRYFWKTENIVTIKLTSAIAGQNGRYNGRTLTGAVNTSASGSLVPGDLGTVSAADNCIFWNEVEAYGGTNHILGLTPFEIYIDAFPRGTDTTSGFPIFTGRIMPIGVFPISLTQTGGANGTKTSAATWTYTATDSLGATLGTVLSPEWPRPFGAVTAATHGIGYYGGSGFVLSIAYEKPGSGGC